DRSVRRASPLSHLSHSRSREGVRRHAGRPRSGLGGEPRSAAPRRAVGAPGGDGEARAALRRARERDADQAVVGRARPVPCAEIADPGEAREVMVALPRIAALAAALALAVPATAQDTTRTTTAQDSTRASGAVTHVPWGVGELLEYDISFGKIHVGNG